MIERYRVTSGLGLHLVEEIATGEVVFRTSDGGLAYDVMAIANGLRARVEN